MGRKSPQLSPGYRNPDVQPAKKQKVTKPFSSNHELSSKSATSERKDLTVKSEPVAVTQDTSTLDTSQISEHSDQYGQVDYEYAGYDNAHEENDYGTAMAVVEDQGEAQAMQDHANTPSEITKLI